MTPETSSRSIPPTEVHFQPGPSIDPNGRIFSWQGGLYRAISTPSTPLYRDLFARGIIQQLVDQELLVRTELTDLTLEGYGLVVRHERLPFVTYPFTWCSEMLRCAGLLVVRLEQQLSKHGFTLQDAHSYNILFDGPQPQFVDLGSITSMDLRYPVWPEDEFCRFFINPLHLAANNQGRVARALLLDDLLGVLPHEAGFADSLPHRSLLVRAYRRIRRSLQSPEAEVAQRHVDLERRLQQHLVWLSRLSLPPREAKGTALPRLPLTPAPSWTAQEHTLYRLLSQLRPAAVLDLQPQDGWFAQVAARQGWRVVAVDEDETRINRIYRAAAQDRLSILPLVMNPVRASHPLGQLNYRKGLVAKRLACDMVFADALVHQLVTQEWLNFEHIALLLARFARKRLLIAWVPPEDPLVQTRRSQTPPWYRLENFLAALEKRFPNIEFFPSHPEGRSYLLCTKS
jgi:hypothetical protein